MCLLFCNCDYGAAFFPFSPFLAETFVEEECMGSVIQLEAWSHPSSWGVLVPPIVGLQRIAVSAVTTQLADPPRAGMRPIKNKSPIKVGKKKKQGGGISRQGFNMGWYFL